MRSHWIAEEAMEAGLRQIREEGGARSAVLSEELDPPWELMIRRRAVVDKLEVQTAGNLIASYRT